MLGDMPTDLQRQSGNRRRTHESSGNRVIGAQRTLGSADVEGRYLRTDVRIRLHRPRRRIT